MDTSILTIREYGKVVIRLREIMDARGITRYNLSRATNTRFEVINKWYQGDVARMDTDLLARICYVLGCKVEDILTYEPGTPRANA